MQTVLRPFAAPDVAAMHSLSDAVGWSQRLEDWRWLTSQGRGVVATRGGKLVGASMCWDYDNAVSSIGAVMVDPTLQGMGMGRRLVEACLQTLQERSVILHATPAGRPLYEKLGFRAQGEVSQHQGVVAIENPAPADVQLAPLPRNRVACAVRLAELGSGLRRTPLITSLIERSEGFLLYRNSEPVGLALVRDYARGLAIGPVIGHSEADARAMLGHCLARAAGKFVRIDLTPDGISSLGPVLEAAGLARVSLATPMVRGHWPAAQPGVVQFAIVTQATG